MIPVQTRIEMPALQRYPSMKRELGKLPREFLPQNCKIELTVRSARRADSPIDRQRHHKAWHPATQCGQQSIRMASRSWRSRGHEHDSPSQQGMADPPENDRAYLSAI
jgi:hypothetical protein